LPPLELTDELVERVSRGLACGSRRPNGAEEGGGLVEEDGGAVEAEEEAPRISHPARCTGRVTQGRQVVAAGAAVTMSFAGLRPAGRSSSEGLARRALGMEQLPVTTRRRAR